MKIKIDLEEMMWRNRVKNISQLSEKCGVSRPTLYRISKGDVNSVSIATLISICNALDCKVEDLLVIEKEVG